MNGQERVFITARCSSHTCVAQIHKHKTRRALIHASSLPRAENRLQKRAEYSKICVLCNTTPKTNLKSKSEQYITVSKRNALTKTSHTCYVHNLAATDATVVTRMHIYKLYPSISPPNHCSWKIQPPIQSVRSNPLQSVCSFPIQSNPIRSIRPMFSFHVFHVSHHEFAVGNSARLPKYNVLYIPHWVRHKPRVRHPLPPSQSFVLCSASFPLPSPSLFD